MMRVTQRFVWLLNALLSLGLDAGTPLLGRRRGLYRRPPIGYRSQDIRPI